ncbi:MAG: FlxA-like family protein [Clostridiales bacterium]|nr:FlxA-like family protein [Clostridiales bacterium]
MEISLMSSSYLSSYEKTIEALEDQVKEMKKRIQITANSDDNAEIKHQKLQLIQAQIDQIALQF